MNYDIAGQFEYQAVKANLEALQMQALEMRPDLRAAQQGITAANSQYLLAKADGKQDVTVQANYSHVNGINAASFYASIPLANLQSQSGRDCAHAFRHRRSRKNSKGRPTIRWPRMCTTPIRSCRTTISIVQLYLGGYLGRSASGPRYCRIWRPARRGQFARFSRCRAQLSRHATDVPAGAGSLSHRARTASRGRGHKSAAGDPQRMASPVLPAGADHSFRSGYRIAAQIAAKC